MLEKTLEISGLLDVYGELLTEHQRELLRCYYECDISLFELSEQFGISRQGVRDALVRGEKQLGALESALGLLAKREQIAALCQKGVEASEGEIQVLFNDILNVVMDEEK